jgi:hypothetical protein
LRCATSGRLGSESRDLSGGERGGCGRRIGRSEGGSRGRRKCRDCSWRRRWRR